MSDLLNFLNENEQRALYRQLSEKFGQQDPDTAAGADYGAKAAEMRNQRMTANNPAPGLLDGLK